MKLAQLLPGILALGLPYQAQAKPGLPARVQVKLGPKPSNDPSDPSTNPGTSDPDVHGTVVGGVDAGTVPPWMVYLRIPQYDDFQAQYCGGSLIGTNLVLTAAHCPVVYSHLAVALRYNLRDDADFDDVYMSVVESIGHPYFDDFTYDFDARVLKVTAGETLTESVDLYRQFDLSSLGKQTIYGWGTQSYYTPSFPDNLQTANVSVVPRDVCESQYGAELITSRMMCAADPGIDTCQGDSGGPLGFVDPVTKRFQQVGITSWGLGCANPNYPGVYSNVPMLREWILETARSLVECPPGQSAWKLHCYPCALGASVCTPNRILCPSGQEPTLVDGQLLCRACPVGTTKPTVSDASCSPCVGTQCSATVDLCQFSDRVSSKRLGASLLSCGIQRK